MQYFRHKRNIGANNNFNYCLEKAAGAYFLLLHDDDLIDADLISVCLKAVNYNDTVGIIRTGVRSIDSDENIILEIENLVSGQSLTDFFLAWFSSETPIYFCSTLFNTKRLKQIGGIKSKHNLYQDVIAVSILAARYGRVDVKEVKASFRYHPLQYTNIAAVGSWCEDSKMVLDVMCDLAPEDKELLWRTGFQYLLKRNFMMATRIQSPLQKYMAYLIVFKTFNFPIKFFAERLRIKINEFKEAAFH